ncbi:MAG: penicillin-binding protein 2, partial [Mycobacterium sp.]|nr:penicillin-binding protein 2 [Mycobacterium sp.]
MIVFAGLAVLLLRLWSLQVLQHDQYQVKAEDNRVRTVVTPAPRGEIVDDQGNTLATNRTSLVITVDRSVLDRQA